MKLFLLIQSIATSSLPGIDFPNSRYSRTEGLKKFVGISGMSLSGLPLSSLSKSCGGSGSKIIVAGALGLFALFERTVSRQSEKK